MSFVGFMREEFPRFLREAMKEYLKEINLRAKTESDMVDTSEIDLALVDDFFIDCSDSDLFSKYGGFYGENANEKFSISCGASKLVAIPEKENFVVKLVFAPEYIVASEYEIYQQAKEKDLEDYFAPCWGESYLIFDFFGLTLRLEMYCQEKVSNEGPMSSRFREEIFCDAKEWVSFFSHMSKQSQYSYNFLFNHFDEDFALVISATQRSDLTKLSNFLKSFKISDLHNGNFVIQNDQIVLFDYSGYED